MERLFGFGHTILSDLPIPGALPCGDDGQVCAPVLSVDLTEARDCPQDEIYRRDGDALLFAPPGVGLYRCRATGIKVTPQPGSDHAELSALLIATALPAVQWLQRNFMAHAAGIVLPGSASAIAITGNSGSGKSTAAAALLARGARLLGDDSLRIAPVRGDWMASGLPGGLYLPDGDRPYRCFAPVPVSRAVAEARLGAIFVLGQRQAAASIRRVDGVAALAQVLAMQHRPRVPTILGQRHGTLQLAAGIARSLPVFVWERRSGAIALEQQELDMLQVCCGEER